MGHGNAVKHRNVVLEPGRGGEHAAGFELLGGEVRGTSGWPSAAWMDPVAASPPNHSRETTAIDHGHERPDASPGLMPDRLSALVPGF